MTETLKEPLPSLKSITDYLRPISWVETIGVILIPLITFVSYFIFCYFELYLFALLSVMYLSFATYGSCSHELVHENTRFPKKISNFFLSLIELLMLRSGTVYKCVHLNHHKLFPNYENDPEGQASYFSFFRTILEGPILHIKLILWTFKNKKQKIRVTIELILVFLFICMGIYFYETYPELIVYQALVYMGSWIIPLITSYLVHVPQEKEEIKQTRVYRGIWYRIIAFDHLYHLEHHLYPKIPHHRWPELAKILNLYFEKRGIRPRRLDYYKTNRLDLN